MILTSPSLGVFSLRNIVNQSVRNITAGTIRNNMILRRTEQIQKKLDMKEMSLVQRFLERQQTSVEPERLDNSPMVDSISQEDQSQAPQSYYVEKTIIQRV